MCPETSENEIGMLSSSHVITAGRKVGNEVWKHQAQNCQECWHCCSQSNLACKICFLQIVLGIDLWLQFENFKYTGVIESLIRINRTIRIIHVGRQFFKISHPNPGQTSDISPLCCEKTCSSFSFVSASYLVCQCTAAKQRKSFSFCH